MTDRRGFLHSLINLTALGNLPLGGAQAAPAQPDYLKELGVRPIINGSGAYTAMTGSLMWPQVPRAIEAASRQFVRLDELHDAVGKRIAKLLGCEAAMVPAGAAAGLTLGAAACITGADPALIKRLPDATGMKNEVIVQKSHRFPYDHMVRNCGVRLIEVETREELERALNERTALLLFLNKHNSRGRIKLEEFVQLGKKHKVPTFNDAAADAPPVENLWKYTKMGFDLVTFSGGKGIRGPQSAGLLLGRADLIRAARLNTAPHSDSIGRGLKVNKEEMVGMLVALELYLKHDHAADWREWEQRVKLMGETLSSLRGVTAERFTPEIANQVPHLRVRWDASLVRITPAEVMRQLREGNPSIELVPAPEVKESLEIASWMLQPGEAQIVARRIRETLKGASQA
jgi:L-seryl-tRNA(Ser) seleniumtransferase